MAQTFAFELTSTKLATLVAFFFGYQVLKAIYRITLHPLARFPGRRLAAMTYKYEFYFDGVKDGSYIYEIANMHEEFGESTEWDAGSSHEY
jgi:hypothetical protein